jgi:pyrroline-5-carboxylate reductase
MAEPQTPLANISGTVVLAGAGKMGGALLTGWLAGGLDPKCVAVIEPHLSDDIRALAARGIRLNSAANEAVAALVLAVKPQTFGDAGPALRPFVGASTLVVSIMAGTTIAVLDAVCGGNIVRAMPNTPAAIGRGITVAVAAKGVNTEQRATADALLRATGTVEWIDDEALMDAVTAVSGSGPAYVFLLAEELARAGVAAGRSCREAGPRDRRRFRRTAAPIRSRCRDAAPERHLARRHHRCRTRCPDGREWPERADDARGRRRDKAIEGTGEVISLLSRKI